MTEVPYVNYEMPPIDDAMFFGLDPAAYGASSSAARDEEDGEEDEDEEEEEESPHNGDDDDAFYSMVDASIAYSLSLFGVSMPKGEKRVEFYLG
jgi:hypothetical protein